MAMRELVGSVVVSAVVAAATTFVLHRTVLQREPVEVPSVLGMPVQSARALAENRGLLFVVGEEREDSRTPAGNVLLQKPLEGSRIDRGQALEVVVAKMPALVRAPAVVGLALADARLRIETFKLAVGKVVEQTNPEIAAGHVISQSLTEGSEVRLGTAIDLVVSKGVDTVPVPNVVGRSLFKAKEELQKAGLKVGNLRSRSDDDRSDGLILEQSPSANQPAAKGSAVDLVVNRT